MGPVPVGGAGVDRRAGRRSACSRTTRRTPAPAGAFIDDLIAKPDAAIGLAIFPRVAVHGRRLGDASPSASAGRTPTTPFLAAAFHPDYRAPGETPTRARRRAPGAVHPAHARSDAAAGARVAASTGLRGQVSADVGRANFANVTARGLDELDALLADIRRDRDASYARLC